MGSVEGQVRGEILGQLTSSKPVLEGLKGRGGIRDKFLENLFEYISLDVAKIIGAGFDLRRLLASLLLISRSWVVGALLVLDRGRRLCLQGVRHGAYRDVGELLKDSRAARTRGRGRIAGSAVRGQGGVTREEKSGMMMSGLELRREFTIQGWMKGGKPQ